MFHLNRYHKSPICMLLLNDENNITSSDIEGRVCHWYRNTPIPLIETDKTCGNLNNIHVYSSNIYLQCKLKNAKLIM